MDSTIIYYPGTLTIPGNFSFLVYNVTFYFKKNKMDILYRTDHFAMSFPAIVFISPSIFIQGNNFTTSMIFQFS